VNRIDITITRLKASGATDPNIEARVQVLRAIKNTVNDLISDINSGVKKITDLTTTKAELDSIIPKLGDISTPISNIFGAAGMDSVLNLLFPLYGSGDLSGSRAGMELLKQYLNDLAHNTSWDLELHYKSSAEKEIAMDNAYGRGLNKHGGKHHGSKDNDDNSVDYSHYRGVMDSVTSSLSGIDATSHFKGDDEDRQAARQAAAAAASGSTTGFDWKKRSKDICKQIDIRGYKSYDFGCLKDPANLQDENFSWRGYMRMVCTRLATLYDPSIPELCGCPPPSWIGWRS
jgi:hypothetical protein